MLATREWDWTDLCDASIPESGVFSRALPHEEVEHPLLAGVEAEWLKRWDGRPGTVSVAGIAGRAVEAGELVLWAVEPARSVVAQLPAASGDGMLLFCQLDLQSHIAQGSARCDPVAERILLNLLAW